MNRTDVSELKSWFAGFCRSYYSTDENEQRNILLKELHTHNVCDNILLIAGDESLTGEQQRLAEVIALFHDVGRFPQYRQYKTFKDSDSTNHAALGAKVLLENDLLARFSSEERDIIIQSVRLHNAFTVPPNLSDSGRFFLKMIRDADKLDIWRVFVEYYALPETERASAVGLGFPDLPSYADEVLACFDRGEMVNLAMLRTLNDFKLLQLSWVFDLNFTASFKKLKELDYIGRIAATLPQDGPVDDIVRGVREFVAMKLAVGAAA